MLLHVSASASDVLVDASVAIACCVCYRRARLPLDSARRHWALIALALFFWCYAEALLTYDEIYRPGPQQSAALSPTLYYFLFGISLLLVISSIGHRRKIPAVIWVDAFQGLIGIYLIHLQVFSSPTGASLSPAISELRLSYAYNAGNLTLALGATLRVMAQPRDEEARVYRVLCLFLWVYALASGWLNHLSLASDQALSTRWDLLWALPFVLLTILVARLSQDCPRNENVRHPTWAGLIVTNASPVFFTMGLLITGVYVGREHFIAGTAAIAFSLISYSLRSSILQSESMRMERKLLESEAALVSANARLEELSFVDQLTGVANLRRFEVVLTDEWKRGRRLNLPLSLLVIDIDHFKRLNDRYGHLRGDWCLSEAARALSGCLSRAGEMLARYGGEEFVALLPGLDLDRSCVLAERMREAIEALSLPNEGAPAIRMTVSIGAASNRSAGVLRESDLFAIADRALYKAKSRGRNRVEVGGLELHEVEACGPLQTAELSAPLRDGPSIRQREAGCG